VRCRSGTRYAGAVSHAVFRLARRVRPSVREDANRVVTGLAQRHSTRGVLNAAYELLPPARKGWTHAAFGQVLGTLPADSVQPGVWRSAFAGRTITVPIEGPHAPFLLDFGLALEGHDVEVKQLYRRLLTSAAPPAVFYDIGTNFGTHSLLFLVHGVRTVSFEPNPACHALFRSICEANDVEPDLRALALGEQEGSVVLTFPPGLTWLGTTKPEVGAERGAGRPMETVEVPCGTLDAFVAAQEAGPDLVKIDTEGNELGVLRGATRTLAEHRPIVVFESLHADRGELWDLWSDAGYAIRVLPDGPALDARSFGTSPETNFVAVPQERELPA